MPPLIPYKLFRGSFNDLERQHELEIICLFSIKVRVAFLFLYTSSEK